MPPRCPNFVPALFQAGPARVNIKATEVWYHVHPVHSPQDVLSYATAMHDSHIIVPSKEQPFSSPSPNVLI